MFTKKNMVGVKYFLLTLLSLPFLSFGQLFDDFGDGNFSNNPQWDGTASKFTVNSSFQLQLNDTEASTAWLSTPYAINGNIEWKFWIRLAFSPSSNNYSKVFLVADQPDLDLAQNGYYLRFGESGSNDAIELFQLVAGNSISICRGSEGLIANSFALPIKVVRKTDGSWRIFTDPTGSGLYQLESSGIDNTFVPGGYFGFHCTYTVSNANKMYFDDISIDNEIIDIFPPELISVSATDPFTLLLTFNEALNTTSTLELSNFSVSGGIGQPASAVFGATNAQVVLTFGSSFDSGVSYELTVMNIEDVEGNMMDTINISFSYYEASPNDVVINEIMADPAPVVGLPEWEFVELYNNTDYRIELSEWALFTGTTEKSISNAWIEPKSFLLLANELARAEFGENVPFFGFSTFQLTNSGQELKLVGKQGQLVSLVSYSDDWYRDEQKLDGGWSLEQINPLNPCGGRSNWIASVSPSGGTPGSENSVFSVHVQLPAPERIRIDSETIIQLWFDQFMDAVSVTGAAAYSVQPGNLMPVEVYTNPADQTFVELVFGQPFQKGIIYRLTVAESVLNCAGISVGPASIIEFGIPEMPVINDITINEVLFNPLDNGVDFVEIYNRSEKIINLEQLWLGAVRHSPPNQPDTTLKKIAATSELLLPGQYCVLTTSPEKIKNQYYSPSEAMFVTVPSFPTYPNNDATVLLKSTDGTIIDLMSYNESMHYPLLNSVKGVSLERIDFNRESSDITNWHSAAETAGFATPGYRNSMFAQAKAFAGEFDIHPEIFSPDGDGRDDHTTISYQFDKPGFILNIRIFDASGKQIRHLLKSKLIGQQGSIGWDGLNDQGTRVGVGIYVVHFEIFDLSGNTEHFKKSVVVATR